MLMLQVIINYLYKLLKSQVTIIVTSNEDFFLALIGALKDTNVR